MKLFMSFPRKRESNVWMPVFTGMTVALLVTWQLATCDPAYASNIRVENVRLYKSATQPAGTIDIKFDVTWDASRSDETSSSQIDANSAHYFDRAWIFVRFWDTTAMGNSATGGTGGAYPWGHAIFTSGGSLSTFNATTQTGITGDGIGAFAKPGTNQSVRWNYAGTNIPGTSTPVASTDTIKVGVCAIEMCYIPTGSFWVGDGTTNTVEGQFEQAGTTTPFNITSEGAITLGPGGLGNRSGTGMSPADDFTDTVAPTASPTNLPAAFPKGYNAFYLMKHDIIEGQYVLFLNSLTRKQQINRVASAITADTVTNTYVMSNTTTSSYRNTITCPASGNGTTAPIIFSSARPYRSCSYLSWMDVCAYADWAGLRPMTELEYEKACRGGSPTNNAVAGEYAWGNTTITAANTISGTENGTETITTSGANCNYNSTTFTGGDAGQGPLRAGIFAKPGAVTTRAQSGSGYYGNLDLSGGLWKRPITVGNSTGRSFTGTHGDGKLTINTSSNAYDGNATNTDWPGIDGTTSRGITGATGSGFRGGGWYFGWTYVRVSDRSYAADTYAFRYTYCGGRLARTSP